MRPLYIFDLDDTLTLTAHRQHLKPSRSSDDAAWRTFFEACIDDGPNVPVIRTMQALRRGGADVWFWTGRSCVARALTVRWLAWYAETQIAPVDLRMRLLDDHRPDIGLKREWLREMAEEDSIRLVAAFDDRQHIAEMWREAGVQCYLVGARE